MPIIISSINKTVLIYTHIYIYIYIYIYKAYKLSLVIIYKYCLIELFYKKYINVSHEFKIYLIFQ
jgi:hypothetical protein